MGSQKREQLKFHLREALRLLEEVEGDTPTDPLIGQRFSNLTVVAIAPSVRKSYGTRRVVVCRCTCGKEVKVLLDNLKHSRTKSCGCMKGKRPTKPLELKPVATETENEDGTYTWDDFDEDVSPAKSLPPHTIAIKLPKMKLKPADEYDPLDPFATELDGSTVKMSKVNWSGKPMLWCDYERCKSYYRKLIIGLLPYFDAFSSIELCERESRAKIYTDPVWQAERTILLERYCKIDPNELRELEAYFK